jgi:phosphatidylinositol alpha 1,6-mannosyltransferase
MRHGDHVRVAIIIDSFLPSINRVTTTVLRVLDHLQQSGHPALVVAPGEGTTEHRGTPVVRVPAVDLPRQLSIPVGVPWPGMFRTVARFDPDVVHLAAPFVVGAHGLAVARRLEVPSVAVYQTDIAGFAAAYGMGLTSAAAWRWTCRLHQRADRTLAPSTAIVAALEAHGVRQVFHRGRASTPSTSARSAATSRYTAS